MAVNQKNKKKGKQNPCPSITNGIVPWRPKYFLLFERKNGDHNKTFTLEEMADNNNNSDGRCTKIECSPIDWRSPSAFKMGSPVDLLSFFFFLSLSLSLSLIMAMMAITRDRFPLLSKQKLGSFLYSSSSSFLSFG